MNPKFTTVTCLLTVSLLGMLAARADSSKFPDGPGKATFLKVCSTCHDVDIVADLRHSHDEWKDLVYDMRNKGAEATDKECDVIIDYLYKNFPAENEKKPAEDEKK